MNFAPYEERILNKLLSSDMEKLQIVRLQFGFSLLIDSMKKGIIIYGVAILLNCFFETLLVHLSFLILRQVSFGWHSSNSLFCVVWSVVSFPVFTFLLVQSNIHSFIVDIVFISCIVMIWLIGPVGTSVNSLSNLKHRQLLHRKLKKRILVLTLGTLIVPSFFFPYITLGICIQTMTLIIQLKENGVV